MITTFTLFPIHKCRNVSKQGVLFSSERLIGKSPEYIEVYTATYKRNIGIQRARSAAVGSAMLQGLLLVWAIRDI